MTSRASIFTDDEDFEIPDLSGAAVASQKTVDKEATRKAAAKVGFTDRDPPRPPAVSEPSAPPEQRRRAFRTGRNTQINLKVTAECRDAFLDLVDELSDREGRAIPQGEAFERAVAALRAKLSEGSS